VPLAVLFVGELVFRIVPSLRARWGDPTPPPRPGMWNHVPGETFLYEGPFLGHREHTNEFSWNLEGFHDRDHAREKPAGAWRAVVLGDSFVEGVQVPEEALFHGVLEAELARVSSGSVETIAIAEAGWGQAEERKAFREKGAKYAPDVVILC